MNYFLEQAMELDKFLVSDFEEFKSIMVYLYREIGTYVQIRNKKRTKQTLKLIIINLWVAHQQGVALKYSRNRNHYSSHKRYGKLYFKYLRVIRVFDTLEKLGFIDQYLGFFDRAKGVGRQTRATMTPKMIELFEENQVAKPGLIHKVQPDEIIQLKNEHKKLIKYDDNMITMNTRNNLIKYNEFIDKQAIEIILPPETMINERFLRHLNTYNWKGVITVKDIQYLNKYNDNRYITI